MLNPGKPRNVVHKWGPIYVSAVYSVDPTDPDSEPIMIGRPVIEAEETVLPESPAPAPTNLIGIDIENVAYMIDCARDKEGFRIAISSADHIDATLDFHTNPLSRFGLHYPDFAPAANPTHRSIAARAHEYFNRQICPGFCPEDFYQSAEYTQRAAELNQYIDESRSMHDPTLGFTYGQDCPHPARVSD